MTRPCRLSGVKCSMKPLGSNLTTLPGLLILAALTLLAAHFGFRELEALLLALLVLCLAAYLWARFSLSKISVSIADEDCRAFPGEVMEARAQLKNAKLLPLVWLRAAFPARSGGCVLAAGEDGSPVQPGEDAEPEISESFVWLMPHQTVEWTQRVCAVRRGVCRVDSVCLISGDGFGLSERLKKAAVPGSFRFIVYPAVRPVSVQRIINNMSELQKSPSGFYTDPTLTKSVREYRDGDSPRSINWRSLARGGQLLVNVYERLDMRRVCLMADLEAFSFFEHVDSGTHTGTERRVNSERMEHMLSLLASCILALDERGVLCSLIVPAYGNRAARIITPEAHAQTAELLTALAEIDYSGEETFFPVDGMTDASHLLGQLFVFTGGNAERDAELERLLSPLRLFRIVQREGEGADSQTICETELTCP